MPRWLPSHARTRTETATGMTTAFLHTTSFHPPPTGKPSRPQSTPDRAPAPTSTGRIPAPNGDRRQQSLRSFSHVFQDTTPDTIDTAPSCNERVDEHRNATATGASDDTSPVSITITIRHPRAILRCLVQHPFTRSCSCRRRFPMPAPGRLRSACSIALVPPETAEDIAAENPHADGEVHLLGS